MRRTTIAAAYAILAVVFAFTWQRFDESESRAAEIYFSAAFLIQPVTGFLLPRLWTFGLPFIPLAAVLPWSEPDPEYFGITDAGVMFIGGFLAMILMSFGMACRLTIEAFRDPPEPARTR
jgi:hypothetical protein